MVNLLALDFGEHLLFFLILLRISGILFFAPVFNSNSIPSVLRILLSFMLSLLIFDLSPAMQIRPDSYTWVDFLVIAFKEFFLGFLIGLLPQLVFTAIDLAGSIIGNMIGISIVNLLDPQTDTQVSLVSSFKSTLALMIFLILDFHHVILKIIFDSFQILPLGGISIEAGIFDTAIRYTSLIFILGVKISAPLLIVMLLTNLIMGFMARSVPNLNVFIVGFPISLLVGFSALAITIPPLILMFSNTFEDVMRETLVLIKALAP